MILQTNDTHSNMYPTDKGLGGLARRVALMDSVRGANAAGSVITVDTGDAVQGTLFFNVYGGEVENRAMRLAGYDMAVLGNHDFDNGADSLAATLRGAERRFGPGPEWITTNYRFDDNSPLSGLFKPYSIREVDGKKIGFIGLNLIPKGMIAEGNYDGVEYLDAIKAANSTAWVLKNLADCDLVVALTHLGYNSLTAPTDRQVAAASEDIDIILGGHSHTLIEPGSGDEWVENAKGRKILVAQSGSRGERVGEITVNLDSIETATPKYRLYTLDNRYDGRERAEEVEAFLTPYNAGIDAEMSVPVAEAAYLLDSKEPGLLNFVSDFIKARGDELVGESGVDFAIMNKGSLRRSLEKGKITRGDIFTLQPFNNKIQVLELTGQDVIDALQIMAARGGDGVSQQVDVTFSPIGGVITANINGKEIEPKKTYRVATIDYLAHGGDYMVPLTRGAMLTESPQVIRLDLLDYLAKNYNPKNKKKKINPSRQARMRAVE